MCTCKQKPKPKPVVLSVVWGASGVSIRPRALASPAPSGVVGVLASVRGVVFHARRLDDVPGDLDVFAELLGGAQAGVLYRFEVSSAGRALLEGRVSVAFAR